MSEQAFPNFRESHESQIAKLLAEAIQLQITHKGDNAIWQALTNFGIQGQAERTQFFRLLKPKIERGNMSTKSKKNEHVPFSERTNILADAYGHQQRQPRDTWDPTLDDESPDE